MSRHLYIKESKHRLPGSLPAQSGEETLWSVLEGGGKVAPTLPNPLPQRSFSSASGGGITPLVAVSCSRSTHLFLLVSVESESLQRHSVTLTGGLWKSKGTIGSCEEHTPGSASTVVARIR